MMMVTATDVATLIDEIWMVTLGLPVRPTDEPVALSSDTDTIDGIVNISGDRQMTVVLQVPRALAVTVAAAMFGLGGRTPRAEDMQDAVGELTNMLGGSIKALLAGHCHLSLPAVVHGKGYTIRVPSSHVAERFTFECDGNPAVVSLMAAAARP